MTVAGSSTFFFRWLIGADPWLLFILKSHIDKRANSECEGIEFAIAKPKLFGGFMAFGRRCARMVFEKGLVYDHLTSGREVMSLSTHYGYDVFVSYASVDNKPPVGMDNANGWVSNLVSQLRLMMEAEFGRSGAEIWMDTALASNDPITSTIPDAVNNSALILLILSNGYLESEWCARERSAFLEHLPEGHCSKRIFLVEMSNIGWECKPREIRDIKGTAFWECSESENSERTLGYPTPSSHKSERYYSLVQDLARDVTKELQRLRLGEEKFILHSGSQGRTVLLADVTDDLVDHRDAVKRYLEQQGISVVEGYYPPEPEAFIKAFKADLARSQLFVQLLSGLTGKKPPGAESGFPFIQHQTASSSEGVSILQWYAPDIDMNELQDGPQKDLLLQSTVIVEAFEQFKARVAEAALEGKQEESGPSGDKLVFVNCASEDTGLADSVRAAVDELGMDSAVPTFSGGPAELRLAMETLMSESDAMILLYGEAGVTWVNSQLLQFRKYRKHKGGKKPLAVYKGPPRIEKDLGVKLSEMRVIDCRDGVDLAEVKCFLEDCAGSC